MYGSGPRIQISAAGKVAESRLAHAAHRGRKDNNTAGVWNKPSKDLM